MNEKYRIDFFFEIRISMCDIYLILIDLNGRYIITNDDMHEFVLYVDIMNKSIEKEGHTS